MNTITGGFMKFLNLLAFISIIPPFLPALVLAGEPHVFNECGPTGSTLGIFSTQWVLLPIRATIFMCWMAATY